MSIEGVDLSDFQSVDSFHAMQADGIGFAISKATEGTGNVQDTFAGNRDRARSISMIFGAYHFLSWDADPVAQAEHFLSVYTPKNGDLPPMIDCEAFPGGDGPDSEFAKASDAQKAAWRAQADAVMAGFNAVVEPRLGGSRCLLYANYANLQEQRFTTDNFAGHLLFIAEYNSSPEPSIPCTWTKATFWQYSGSGTVPGITGEVDRDRFLGSAEELAALTLKGIA